MNMWGPDMAPHTPPRSAAPGEPGVPSICRIEESAI
jgi:hypothetical protein